ECLGCDIQTAQDGIDALDRISEHCPDLVITDLQMPNCDGLGLIHQMLTDCPMVPSILVTAFGNEALAAEALGSGATTYIAKEHVDVLLADTARRLLAFAQANRESLEIKGTLGLGRHDFLTDCSIERLVPLVSLVVRLLGAMGALHTSDRIRIAETLHHLLFHAIIHENLNIPLQKEPIPLDQAETWVQERFKDSRASQSVGECVRLRMNVTNENVSFRIDPEGRCASFDQAPLPGTPQSFSDERARAMLLSTSTMDEVFIDPNTSAIKLVKHLSGQPSTTAVAETK
ncbi:MAG: response regulator, partial [Planctomycetota bacterium]